MPPLSLITDGSNWKDRKIILRKVVETRTEKVDEIAIGYGRLFEVTIDFLIVGLSVFLVVKLINTLRSRSQDPKNETVTTVKDIELLNRITELLEEQNLELKKKG